MKLDYQQYYDKVLGAWIGKCAGGILGAPIEGVKDFNNIELSEKLFETNYPNDDLDLQLLWLDMVKKKGPKVRETDFAEHWLNHVGFPWNEYGIATRNLRLGIYPPNSGKHNNYYFAESMGCPIRSEIWGLLNPGNPAKAAFYAGMDASLDHYGFSVDAEKFLSACTAIAFLENDIRKIFAGALKQIPAGSVMHQLVINVINWNEKGGYGAARGKIKSFYGDADFTSAPMNVGFTLLALIDKGNDFGCVMDALHMGHDSDCIAATAGALVGTISGYDKIHANWKKMVGDELLMSREITGIQPPESIKDLAEQTCRAGLNFINTSKKIKFAGSLPEEFKVNPPTAYHIKAIHSKAAIDIVYENLSGLQQDVKVSFSSKEIKFGEKEISLRVKKGQTKTFSVGIHAPVTNQPALPYTIGIYINSKKAGSLKQAVPAHGSWILAGPFIEDDKSLLNNYFEGYPEHGLSSLPSVQYMNHDKINHEKDFISLKEIYSLADESSWNQKSYLVKRIYPSDFRLIPDDWYYGNGERTIYLYSTVTMEKAKKMWVCLGATSPFELKINGKTVCLEKLQKRAWIGNSIFVQSFKKGVNHIVLRADLTTDHNQIECALKEFTGKHPHQEQWSLLVPSI